MPATGSTLKEAFLVTTRLVPAAFVIDLRRDAKTKRSALLLPASTMSESASIVTTSRELNVKEPKTIVSGSCVPNVMALPAAVVVNAALPSTVRLAPAEFVIVPFVAVMLEEPNM